MTSKQIMDAWYAEFAGWGESRVIAFSKAIIAIERERCAKVCSDLMTPAQTSDPMVAGANIALGEAVKRIQE